MAKKKKKTRWYDYVFHLLAFVLAVVFIVIGGTKLIDYPSHVANFAKWNYPTWFMYVTGGVEVAGGILLILPITRYYGATLIVFTMIGAILTHIRAGEWFFLGTPILLLIAAFMISIRRTFQMR